MFGSFSYQILLYAWMALAIIVFFVLLLIPVPYGRYVRKGWGPTIANRWGWMIMESASAVGFFIWFLLGQDSVKLVPVVFLVMWEFHYIYRAFIYPVRLRYKRKPMPLLLMFFGIVFNFINVYFNGRYIFIISEGHLARWVMDFRFIIGFTLFIAGIAINIHSDNILINLRKSGETGYHIPNGILYEWISCPNYFGEIVEWVGWAIATWSLPGLSFALWTTANLAPRAKSHHLWYHEHFKNYPKKRKILLPGIW